MKVPLRMLVSCLFLMAAVFSSIHTKVVPPKRRLTTLTNSSTTKFQNVTGRLLNIEDSTGISLNIENDTTTTTTSKNDIKWPSTEGNNAWKGFFIPALFDGVANETVLSTTTEGFSKQDKSPVFPRVLYETTTTVIPPIYRATYLKNKQPVSTSPRTYSVQMASTDNSDYFYYPRYSTEAPTTTSVPYNYPPSYASVGKSYGGSGGSSPSSGGYSMYGNMGMGGGMASGMSGGMASGMGGGGGGGYGSGAPAPHVGQSYGPSYGSMQPSGVGGMMYGYPGAPGMMYGAGGGNGGSNMPAKDELGLKSFLNKLLTLLPVGLLLAVALPSLVVVPSKRSLNNDESSSLAKKTLSESYPILDMINYYGIQSFQDEKCFRHVLCKTIRLGSQDGANVFQKQLWIAINWMDNTLAQNIGIEELWKAIIKDQCSLFSCKLKKNGANETSTPPL